MRLVIMQPSYMPWLGYFDLILKADLFVVYDHVQYDKDGWRNRNRIKTKEGVQWLTVPVLTKGLGKPTNRNIRINHREPWRRKHLGSLEANYRKAAYFDEVFPMIKSILDRPWDFLLDLNMECIRQFCQFLEVDTNLKFASEIDIPLPEDRNEKLVAYCRHIGADEFYEPEGGRSYIDVDRFQTNGIQLVFQDFQHPLYEQLHGPFVSHLSVIDLLFNCGKESVSILKSASQPV